MNTGFNASSNFSVTSLSFGGYTSTSTNANGNGYHGALPPILMHSFRSFGVCEFYRPDGSLLNISGVTGMVQANQLGTISKLYKNNTIGAQGILTITSLPNVNMFVGATSNNGSPTYYDNKSISYYYY
jgi:hypothetical protein